MKQCSRLFASIAVAAVFTSASPASATLVSTPASRIVYYSDATFTEEVGHTLWTGCDQWGQPILEFDGTYTQYQQEILVGYCHRWEEEEYIE